MNISTSLPPEVLAQLAPAVAVIADQAASGVQEREAARLSRQGDVLVRTHGSDYRLGVNRILATALPTMTGGVVPQGDSEDGEDTEEEECEYACNTCGCCIECDRGRHGEADEQDPELFTNRRHETYCASCEHLCD